MSKSIPMQYPYGAVYFRKSNPPREDWERDYRQAAKDGYNIFRHWFMWGAIEVAPGVYDWDDYDRQLELAEKYGIKTIIAEISTCVPDWVFTRYPEAICETAEGKKAKNQMGVSSAIGGFYDGVCLDTPKGKELIGNFIGEMARRYKGHPALLGYDVWNECNYPHNLCYCEETRKLYRVWLEKKYGSLKRLKEVWYRYSLTGWEDVQPPDELALYPESFDWLEFRKVNAYRQMKWRLDILRENDPDCLLTAHGTAQSLDNMAMGGSDEWMSADLVETYGYTFVQSRKGAESYKQFCAGDLTRSGAKKIKFWHAEAQGGPLWLQPQVTGRERTDGRVTQPEDIRLWNLTSFATGARGLLYPRWRPLLDGPLFGAFGPYGMDGLPTPRSEMTSVMAKWANAPEQEDLLKASPIRGEIAILILPETQSATFLLSRFGSEDNYSKAVMGVYRAFYDQNIQADFVHIEDIDLYSHIYMPIPVMITKDHAERLTQWIGRGGKLFSEGCPGYFGDHGKVGTCQPNSGLDQVFGVKEEHVEFTQDLIANTCFSLEDHRVFGGEYWQTYLLQGAVPCLKDDEGRVLAAKNSFEKGETILVGTCPSFGYWNNQGSDQKAFFQWAARWFGIDRYVESSNGQIKIRMQQRDQEIYLWILNTSRDSQCSTLRLAEHIAGRSIDKIFWNGGKILISDQELEVNVEGRNAIVVKLK